MHPSVHARTHPDKPAIVIAETGDVITYRQLEEGSNRAAQLFRRYRLAIGDTVALCMDNHPRFLEIVWGAQRAGLYYTCISSKLTTAEAEFILRDSGAKLIIMSSGVDASARDLARLVDIPVLALDDLEPSVRSFEAEVRDMPARPVADERPGTDLLYSSGTTGRPKGVRVSLPEADDIAADLPIMQVSAERYGINQHSIYLCPAPLYHAAPLRFCMTVHRFGGTVVVMRKFDAEKALALIERYKVTFSQWVPTHFIRMLKLPPDVRARYDISSLTVAVHAAAPCPVPVKHAMIAWWGPILFEYYAGTEGNGMTLLTSPEWLEKPGSVGRSALGIARICDEEGNPLPANMEGEIYFEGGPPFAYLNDPEKTAASTNTLGWTTLGDVGRLDEDGYLFLTDRKSFMIISGGVNIYPQEIENLLITHPDVEDVAVIGAPDPEMGERVVAVIQPVDWSNANDAFAEDLKQWARKHLSGVKMPRQFDFDAELPRHPNGKLLKRLVRDRYWPLI